jgi:putative mRNA 3-end processing factor
MQIRGNRRRRALDRGFVLSDHADWMGLLDTIQESAAEKVWVSHGFTEDMVQHLRENGMAAEAVPTVFSTAAEEVDE